VRSLPTVNQLTCIWMLTPGDRSNDGNRRLVPHGQAASLAEFLQSCVAEGRRDVREIAAYFSAHPFSYCSYGDEPAEYLTRASRAQYFASIPQAALRRSVVFFDPDNGMEPAGGATAAHLKYQELLSIVKRMDRQSIAVVYQHLPRKRGDVFWPATAAALRGALGDRVGYVAAGDVAFYCIARSESAGRRLDTALRQFAEHWPRKLSSAPVTA
jgi:hypothetical protein